MTAISKRTAWLTALAVGSVTCGVVVYGAHAFRKATLTPIVGPSEVAHAHDAGVPDEDEERAYAFRLPSGEPAALTCEEARTIVAQVRTGLAYEPEPVTPKALAAGTADWLD